MKYCLLALILISGAPELALSRNSTMTPAEQALCDGFKKLLALEPMGKCPEMDPWLTLRNDEIKAQCNLTAVTGAPVTVTIAPTAPGATPAPATPATTAPTQAPSHPTLAPTTAYPTFAPDSNATGAPTTAHPTLMPTNQSTEAPVTPVPEANATAVPTAPTPPSNGSNATMAPTTATMAPTNATATMAPTNATATMAPTNATATMAPTNATPPSRRLLADASASANTTTGCADVLKHYAQNTQDFAAAAGLKHTSFYLTLRLGIPLEVGEAKSKLLAQVYQALSEFDAVKKEPSRRRAVKDFTYKTFNGHYTVTEVAEYDKCAPFATTAPTPNPSVTQAPTAFPTPNATPVPTLAPTANTSAPTTAAPTNTSAPTTAPTPNPATMAPTSFVPTAFPTFAPVQTFQCAQLNVTVYHPADAKYGTAFTTLKTEVTKDASDPVGKLAMNLKNAGVQIRVATTANSDIQTYAPTAAPTPPTAAPTAEEKKSSTTLIVVIVVIVVVVVVVVAAVAVSKKRATFQKSTERQAGIDL